MCCDAHGYQQQRPQQNMDSITKHFQGMELAGTNSLSGHSDCVICGKSVEQIKDEAVIDYMHKTAIPNESPQQFNSRRLAFLEGMEIGAFLLIPGGVSQAAACDGNFYTIDASRQNALAHCHYNETFNIKVIILKLLVMVFLLFVLHVNVVDILCA